MFPKSLPHLVGALKMLCPPGQKLCIHCAAAFVLDTPGAIFACGTFRPASPEEQAALGPNASTVPFIHAWAEYRDEVWSPTAMDQMGGELRPMNRLGYYQVNGARDVRLLSRPVLLQVARDMGLSKHLRRGVPTKGNVSVGETILNAAGKQFRVEGHALLPAEVSVGAE